jgi:hypothetical protein
MKIVSLDPGGTTGWAMLNIDPLDMPANPNLLFLRDHVKQGQVGSNSEHHMLLWNFLIAMGPDVIVGEPFKSYGNEFAKAISREYIGIVKLYEALYNVKVVWQGSDKKEWATNEKLRKLLLLCIPLVKWRHANDAIRHLVYYVVFGEDDELQAIRAYILSQLKESQLTRPQ